MTVLHLLMVVVALTAVFQIPRLVTVWRAPDDSRRTGVTAGAVLLVVALAGLVVYQAAI